MTIWDTLVQRLHPKQEKQASYEFATPEFISAFTKIAASMDLTGDELKSELDKLDAKFKNTNPAS